MGTGQCDVLVVDDQAPVRQMMRLMIQQFGLGEVALAHDGVEAVASLEEAVPRAIITDINMPNMNGLELVKRVRSGATAAARNLPILLLTGHGESILVSTAVALDVDGFVLKPAGPANLRPRLERVLGDQRIVPKDAEVYLAVPIPDLTHGTPSLPAEPLTAPPGTRIMPLELDAIDEVLALPVKAKDGWSLYAAGTVVTADMLIRLHDLAEIGLVHPGIVVRI
jgi:CheY-like chemotaxis protein